MQDLTIAIDNSVDYTPDNSIDFEGSSFQGANEVITTFPLQVIKLGISKMWIWQTYCILIRENNEYMPSFSLGPSWLTYTHCTWYLRRKKERKRERGDGFVIRPLCRECWTMVTWPGEMRGSGSLTMKKTEHHYCWWEMFDCRWLLKMLQNLDLGLFNWELAALKTWKNIMTFEQIFYRLKIKANYQAFVGASLITTERDFLWQACKNLEYSSFT